MKHLLGIASIVTVLLIVTMYRSPFAEAQGGHSITISWTAPTSGGAPTSYNVKRSTTTGTEVTVTSVPASTVPLQFVDLGISGGGIGGTTYFYVVTSVNSAGESAPSNEVSATFLVSAPLPPSGLKAVAN